MRTRDHPRACGENLPYTGTVLTGQGSPPRMRGKQGESMDAIAGRWITPAHAGKTTRRRRRKQYHGDHPRACGENVPSDAAEEELGGSPPRMRGKPMGSAPEHAVFGITPAHAGKTFIARTKCKSARDHPRACGENSLNGIFSATGLGSPPRMRGKPVKTITFTRHFRITPAHAGKTNRSFTSKNRTKDHPRACGENRSYPFDAPVLAGSPPRMRGKPRSICGN